MRAEARLRDVAGFAVLVTKQRVQPAIGAAAIAKVIDQLGVSRRDIGDLHRDGTIARQTAEKPLRDPLALGIEHVEP